MRSKNKLQKHIVTVYHGLSKKHIFWSGAVTSWCLAAVFISPAVAKGQWDCCYLSTFLQNIFFLCADECCCHDDSVWTAPFRLNLNLNL